MSDLFIMPETDSVPNAIKALMVTLKTWLYLVYYACLPHWIMTGVIQKHFSDKYILYKRTALVPCLLLKVCQQLHRLRHYQNRDTSKSTAAIQEL